VDSFVSLAIIAALVAFCITVVLPIASFIRALANDRALRALTRQLETLAGRVRALELRLDGGARAVASSPRVEPSPMPSEPVAESPFAMEASDVPRPSMPPLSPAAGARPVAADSLEARIGMRWMLYVGTATLVLGLAFFVKYAFDNQWITERLRVGLGAAAGLALVAAGRSFASRGYVLHGRVLEGGGFATLYVSTYAALNFYSLLSAPVAFGLLFAVSLAAGWEADRHRSLGLALAAVIGGFLAPFTIGMTTGGQVALFGYAALLVALTVALSRRHEWRGPIVAAYGLTIVTVLSWLGTRYRPADYLGTEAFLTLFCALFLLAARSIRAPDWRSRLSSALLLTAPVLYHVASLGLLYMHPAAFMVYLIAANLAALVIAGGESRGAVRLIVYVAVAWPFLLWVESHTARTWVLPGAVTLIAIYAMHLMAQIESSRRRQRTMGAADLALLHLNGLGLFAGGSMLIDRVAPGRSDVLAVVLAILNLALARALAGASSGASPHFLALGFAFIAVAIGLAVDGAWAAIGWAAEGAAVACIGLSSGRQWMRLGGVALLMLGVASLLTGDFLRTTAGFVPIVNARALSTAAIVGLLYVVAWLEARTPRSRGRPRELDAIMAVASLVSVAWLTAEVTSYWREHGGTAGSRFAADLSLSIVWALYAIGLVLAGIRTRYAPVRYFAIVLFALTLLKLFLRDLLQISGIYRIAGFVIVGLVLLAASLMYQRFRGRLAEDPIDAGPFDSPVATERDRLDPGGKGEGQ
jgi:uncharacterized membrane protein